LALADKNGYFYIVRLFLKDNEIEVQAELEFSEQLNMNVEYGQVVASSSKGDRIVVACGDKKIRVFVKTIHQEKYQGKDKHIKMVTDLGGLAIAGFRQLTKTKSGYEPIRNHSDDAAVPVEFFICTLWELLDTFELESIPLAVAMSANGNRVAVGTESSGTLIFDVESGCQLHCFKSEGRVRAVDLDSTGKYVLIGGFDNKLRYYNVEGGLEFSHLQFGKRKDNKFGTINSVSLDDGATKIAIGTENGYAVVYSTEIFSKPLFEQQVPPDEKRQLRKTYVVKLSADGELFVYGGYDNCAAFKWLSTESYGVQKEANPFHQSTGSTAFIWGLDIKKHRNGNYIVAVGSWDEYVYVYVCKPCGSEASKVLQLHQNGRVYDVSLSVDTNASFLVVGGKNMQARLYDVTGYVNENNDQKQNAEVITPLEKLEHKSWNNEHKENTANVEALKLAELNDTDRVYCVAISSGAKFLAYGGVSKNFYLHKIENVQGLNQKTRLLHKFTGHHTVHRVQFICDSYLAAVMEDGVFVVHSIASDEYKLVFRCNFGDREVVQSFACSSLEKGFVAVSHGHKVSIFGKALGYGPFDRPSFHLAKTFLKEPKDLQLALETHPTLTNIFESGSMKSLLTVAVEEDNIDAINILLNSTVKNGLLFQSGSFNTALTAALSAVKPKRRIVETLLDAISSGKIINSEALFMKGFLPVRDKNKLRNVVNYEGGVLNALGEKFPSSLLKFLSKLELDDCNHMLKGLESGKIKNAIHVALPFKSPPGFWEKYEELHKPNLLSAKGAPGALQAKRIPFPGICSFWEVDKAEVTSWDCKNSKCAMKISTLLSKCPCESCKSDPDENCLMKISKLLCKFPGISKLLSMYPEIPCNPDKKKAAAFETPLEVIVNTAQVLCEYSVFEEGKVGNALVMLEWTNIKFVFWRRVLQYLAYYTLCGGMDWMLVGASKGVGGYWTKLLAFVLLCSSLFALHREFVQLWSEHQAVSHLKYDTYHHWKLVLYNHFDLWNILDLAAFLTQMITDVLILCSQLMGLYFGAVSMLLLTWRMFSFVRASPTWGPFVRMMQRTMMAMGNFLFFWYFWLFGFAYAFYIILNNYDGFDTLIHSMFTVTMMMFGDYDKIEDVGVHESVLIGMLFHLMMLTSVVIMLNLLVAILSGAYEEVTKNVKQECVYQLACMIIELNKSNGRKFFTRRGKKWVHILQPLSLNQDQTAQNKDP